MSYAGYALGDLALLVFVLALCAIAVSLRRWALPGWHGAEARLGELVLGTSAAVVLLELLGLCSLLRRPALVIGALVLAAAARLLPRRRAASAAEPQALPPGRLVATVAVIAVAAQWLVSIHRNAREGIHAFDSLHYHLTFAAHFAQDHSVLPIHRLDSLGVSTWYPLNSELLQGAGMVLLRTSALTLVLDLLVLTAVLVSAWVLGSQYGVGPIAVLAVCVPLAILGPAYAGSGNNDWMSIWPLLAAVALLAAGRARGRQLSLAVVGVAGLAGGLAMGSKLTVLAPTVALFFAVVALSRGFRWQAAGVSAGAHLLTGGYWYVRDLVIVGNPVPGTKVGIGSFHLPKPATPFLDTQDDTVLHYLTNWHVIRKFYVPGVHWSFGPAWPAVLLVVVAGFVLAARRARQDRLVLSAAVAALVSVLTYLVTPTGAGGPEGNPFLFAFNIRYAFVGIALATLLLVVCTAGTRLQQPVKCLLLAVLLVTMLRPIAWQSGWPTEPLLVVVGLALLLVAVRHLDRRVLVPVAVVAVLVGGLAGLRVQRHYDEDSYQAGSPRDTLYAVVRKETGQRIGLVGFPLQFPYLGPRLGNHVMYLGKSGPQHSFGEYDSCSGLLAEVVRQRVSRVVVQPYENRITPNADEWLRHDPHVRQLFANAGGALFEIKPGVSPSSC